MASTKYDKHGRMMRSMNLWLSEQDEKNIYRVANAHGCSKAAAIRLALVTLCERLDREESTPLLPSTGT